MKRARCLLAAGVFLVGPELSANPLDEISHRDKLYDIAIRGDLVLVVGYPGLLLRSADRGATFEALDPGTDDALFAIDIAEDGRGIIVGRSGLVLATSNGGKSFQRKESGVKEHLFDVCIVEGGEAWAVGHFGTIIHSRDGGLTWERQGYDAAAPALAEGGGAGAGISAAETENEGAVEEARLNSVSFADSKTGWIAGEFGMILHTGDGGKNWKRQRSPSGKLLFAVHAVDRERVLAVGSEGTLVETSDGGRVWKPMETGVSQHLFDVWPAGGRLFLVGLDGVLLIRQGEGKPFERVSVGLYTWLNAVRFLDSRLGFVAGGRGYLLQTQDAGATWRRLSGR